MMFMCVCMCLGEMIQCVCLCVRVCDKLVPQCMHGDQRTALGSWFSPSTTSSRDLCCFKPLTVWLFAMVAIKTSLQSSVPAIWYYLSHTDPVRLDNNSGLSLQSSIVWVEDLPQVAEASHRFLGFLHLQHWSIRLLSMNWLNQEQLS